MQKFNNILFVSRGVTEETDAIKQALSIARNNQSELNALIVAPGLPKEMKDYKKKYEGSLIEHLQKSIQSSREVVKVSENDVPVKIQVESGGTPATNIVRHVLKNEYDLVIKEAEIKEDGKGFKAMDMDLLRKCPVPVWLSRPINKHRDKMKVAVAIDPESISSEADHLSLRLLKISRSLADTCNGELDIISCWDYEFEKYLRHNVWIKMPDDDLVITVKNAQTQHRAALENIIGKSGIGSKIQVHHIRGRAEQMIPQYVINRNIDILVMGTLARTGISGFIIGNTAENIVQKLGCSLLALKPNGFVSPVKAYD